MASNHHLNENGIINALNKVAVNVLEETCRCTLSQDPENIERQIIEFKGRMRAAGLEKFNNPCYVAAISFFGSEYDMQHHDAAGAIILYINEESAGSIVRYFSESGFDDEDEDLVMDCTKKLCQTIAKTFTANITSLGYSELYLSEPQVHRNNIPEGVPFKGSESAYFENNFYSKREKVVVIDLTLSEI